MNVDQKNERRVYMEAKDRTRRMLNNKIYVNVMLSRSLSDENIIQRRHEFIIKKELS